MKFILKIFKSFKANINHVLLPKLIIKFEETQIKLILVKSKQPLLFESGFLTSAVEQVPYNKCHYLLMLMPQLVSGLTSTVLKFGL